MLNSQNNEILQYFTLFWPSYSWCHTFKASNLKLVLQQLLMLKMLRIMGKPVIFTQTWDKLAQSCEKSIKSRFFYYFLLFYAILMTSSRHQNYSFAKTFHPERAKSLYIRISRFFWKGPWKLRLCSIDVFLNADSESPHMT